MDLEAGLREALGDAAAEAPRRPGDERDLGPHCG
jgi:hypothetical protein